MTSTDLNVLLTAEVKLRSLSRVRLFATPWTAAYQAPPPMGFSRQEYWSGVPSSSPDRNLATCYCYVSQSMLYKEYSLSMSLSLGKAELKRFAY